ncbi:acetyl-CoA carboxylase carboxyltransferase subunit alpha [Thalassoglobus polymorphus]|uniref:Acetyl-coenzyme A carboxylase carboxyl transferase subunit alpha n=1 Tax=Thalassoglobus polymorphus TaxID=2527994 RepID=A0A517QKA7_9PLAN|nr:acetyl-CoA carboxylase carboxyltransferase subunit alpha [Thalassoglobus polymorphus]QDT32072.1 Acetyl-coenzyme A carboxylase carboxyl transferase subunit alpha [Thalassoglobus polymorphus]
MSAPLPLPFERPIFDLEKQLESLESQPNPTAATRESIRNIRTELTKLKRETYEQLDAWQIVQVARHDERPKALDYIELVFDEFVELHGDKSFGDDRAILTGLAKIGDRKVMLVAQQKGRNLKERLEHNYGMAHPEGYRKALSKMQMAAKYNLPIVCLIDTAGAYPGIEAEERGQAYQIALNLREMSKINTPIVCVVIGEGGSGGALGIGIGDHISMLRFAYYSVISPEGCAGILWKHAKFADKAALALKFTSSDLLRMGIVDEVIDEPLGGAHRNHRQMATYLTASLNNALKQLSEIPKDELIDRRYDKFRKIGVFEETVQAAPLESEA